MNNSAEKGSCRGDTFEKLRELCRQQERDGIGMKYREKGSYRKLRKLSRQQKREGTSLLVPLPVIFVLVIPSGLSPRGICRSDITSTVKERRFSAA
jgi:hypothetical protein